MNYNIPDYERHDVGDKYFSDMLKQGQYPCRNVVATGFFDNGDIQVDGAAGVTTTQYFDFLKGPVTGAINSTNPRGTYFGNLRMTTYCNAYAGAAPIVGTIWLVTRKGNVPTHFLIEQKDYAAITPNPIVMQYQFLNLQVDLIRLDVVCPALVTGSVHIEYLFNGLNIAYY